MNDVITIGLWASLAAGAGLWAGARLHRRLQLSRAKHRSLAGHSRMAKRIARWIPAYDYEPAESCAVDGAPGEVSARRQAALVRLAAVFEERFARTLAMTDRVRPMVSDLQFIGRYRVPLPFAAVIRERLPVGAFLQASDGVELIDIDGNRFYDLAGSYGVNLFGYDFYKSCIDEASVRARSLGPVLGAYHPAVADVARRLLGLSGQQEVSFHMSGTEAVMQAVRLARYHTGRRYVVRFCGAYHGWWEDVQPGVGNPMPPRETYTLRDMDERTLEVLRTRGDIACVLVNPLQALHPNANAPGDSGLIDGSRRAGFDRAAYTRWLRDLREVCTARGIVLIFDEVFVGFRLHVRGAQAYFGVDADLVTYGKTLGGGFPVGVVCGKATLMRRFDEERPADVCFARGTFNAHPYVICAMQVFLERLETPACQAVYEDLDETWNRRAERFNQRLRDAGVPVRVESLSSIFTITYTQPGRYHWMLQYYLRAHGLALSWVGTGRLIFSLNYDEAAFDAVIERFVGAAHEMLADGWWWLAAGTTAKSIRRQVLRELITELITHRFSRRVGRRRSAETTGEPVPDLQPPSGLPVDLVIGASPWNPR